MPKIETIALFLALTLTAVLASKKLPIDIQLCKINDGDCIASSIEYLLKTFDQGIPALEFPVLDPFFLKHFEFQPRTSGLIRLNQIYSNVCTHGFSEFDIKSVTPLITDTECKLDIEVFAPYLTIAGLYKFNGTFGNTTLDGEGPFYVNLGNCDLDLSLGCTKTDNGFLKIDRVDVKLGTPSKFSLDYHNLVKNDPVLSDSVRKKFTDLSDLFFEESRGDYEYHLAEIIEKLCSAVFNIVAIADLFKQ